MNLSPYGLLLAAVLLAPNLLYALLPPRAGMPADNGASPLFAYVETVGRVCSITLLLLMPPGAAGPWHWAAVGLGALCAALWTARYFLRGRDIRAMMRPLLRVLPLPAVLLPAAALYCASAAYRSLWLAAATTAFALGDLAISLQLQRRVREVEAGERERETAGALPPDPHQRD